MTVVYYGAILIFREMELLGSNIKKIQETETPRKFLIFQETETLENILYSRK